MPETEIDPAEYAENWALVNAPLGERWSGRTRYAAAMYFHRLGELPQEALECYRICARLDRDDPLALMRQRGVGRLWLARLASTKEAG